MERGRLRDLDRDWKKKKRKKRKKEFLPTYLLLKNYVVIFKTYPTYLLKRKFVIEEYFYLLLKVSRSQTKTIEQKSFPKNKQKDFFLSWLLFRIEKHKIVCFMGDSATLNFCFEIYWSCSNFYKINQTIVAGEKDAGW